MLISESELLSIFFTYIYIFLYGGFKVDGGTNPTRLLVEVHINYLLGNCAIYSIYSETTVASAVDGDLEYADLYHPGQVFHLDLV